jgi:predicted DNA-binding ribbon-helix-helix protein
VTEKPFAPARGGPILIPKQQRRQGDDAAMCRIYAGTAQLEYQPVSRSLRVHGAVTSIRLEARFWAILDEMAESEGLTTPKFIAKLHDEVLDEHGDVRNFTSLLRVVCAIYLGRADREPLSRQNAVPTVLDAFA